MYQLVWNSYFWTGQIKSKIIEGFYQGISVLAKMHNHRSDNRIQTVVI